MKIVSLNINSFGGDGETFEGMKKYLARRFYDGNVTKACKEEALSSWNDAINSRSIYKSILKEIDEVDADIILFQEYYINSEAAKKFEEEMRKRNYALKCNCITDKRPRPLCTGAFCRDNNAYEEVKSQFNFDGRIFIFKYEDFYIINAHMPFNPKDDVRYSDNNKKRAEEVEKLWKDIKEYLEERKDKKVIFIGDLNVYQRGTHQYESFVPLFKSDVDMRDLWIEQGGKDAAITCKKDSRVDYALATSGLFERYKYSMSMIPESDEEFKEDWNISDHRMLVVDIEENDMRESSYKDTERRILCSVMGRMFPDGGETYTIEEVKRLFEEEGVYPQNFEDALSKCIEEGWIIDCGNGNYTR